MSGRRKSLAENQGDIGTYFSINKYGTYLENEGKTTGRKQGENSSPNTDLRIPTPMNKLNYLPINSQSAKRPRAPSHSLTEQRKRKQKEFTQVANNNKRMNTMDVKGGTNVNNPPSAEANGFAELEKRLLAGFESMIQKEIEPLKNEIKEMKLEQSRNANNLVLENSEAITRKFQQNEEKHKKLQDRISYLEDQLLEKNIIFQGIYETEFKEIKDIKTQVVKTIAETMNGGTEVEKRDNAKETSVELIERMGRYNPLRTRPVKVKFTDKKDVDNLFKNRKKLPRGIFIDKEYSTSTEKERRVLRPFIKAARRIDKFKGICKLEGPNFVLDGKKYHRQNLHTLPAELEPSKVTSKTNNEVHAFFGELNPLSNFHPCNFTVNNEEFQES